MLAMPGLYIGANLPWYLDPSLLPAAFGLIGVVIGGLITAGSTYLLDVRRERREIAKAESDHSQELKKAARLVLFDILSGTVALERTIESGTFYRLSYDPLADSAWATYRTVFAAGLSVKQW